MTTTRSAAEVWLVGKPTEKLSTARLPSKDVPSVNTEDSSHPLMIHNVTTIKCFQGDQTPNLQTGLASTPIILLTWPIPNFQIPHNCGLRLADKTLENHHCKSIISSI